MGTQDNVLTYTVVHRVWSHVRGLRKGNDSRKEKERTQWSKKVGVHTSTGMRG